MIKSSKLVALETAYKLVYKYNKKIAAQIYTEILHEEQACERIRGRRDRMVLFRKLGIERKKKPLRKIP